MIRNESGYEAPRPSRGVFRAWVLRLRRICCAGPFWCNAGRGTGRDSDWNRKWASTTAIFQILHSFPFRSLRCTTPFLDP